MNIHSPDEDELAWVGPSFIMPAARPPELLNPEPPAQAGDPVDLFSGIQVITNTDIAVAGSRGTIGVTRTYRSLTTVGGPFGIGTNHNYNYAVDSLAPQNAAVLNIIMPDGNRYPFPRVGSAFVNSTIPMFKGATMTANADSSVDLRWKNGTVYHFVPANFLLGSLLASIRDPNGNTITISRDGAFRVAQVTDPVGRSLTFAYDSSGRITSITDPIGRSVQYTYNSQGTIATFTDPAGGVTQYGYDAQNRMIRVTDPRGIVQAQNTLDANGRVIQQLRPDSGVLTFTYTPINPVAPNSQMLQTQVVDSKGVLAAYRFNPEGFVTDVTATQGQTRRIARLPGSNLRASVVEGPSSAGFTYDANGNMLSSTDATGRSTQYTYDPVFSKVASTTDPLGHVAQFTYDARGNPISVVDPKGNRSSYQYDSTGLLIESTDALNQKTKFIYDGFGNLITVTDPLGNTTSNLYDGISRLIATRDSLGRQTSFTYDARGRLRTRTDAKGGVTTFTYDANGNLLSVQDARNNTTSFTYDAMNRLVTRTNALGQTDTRTYDTNGNLVTFVDRRGQTSTFAYDNLNRLVSETYQDATVTRTYDVLGRLALVNDSAASVFTFSYDAAGRLTGSSTPFGTVSYTYDGRGAMALRQVGGQPAVSYSYDQAGNLTSAAIPQASATFTYNARNQLSGITRLNGVSSAFGYDAPGRLLSLVHSRGPSIIDAQSYTYDAVGNRIARSTNIAQPLITQAVANQFNAANQLIQFGTTPNTYDANGNLAREGAATIYTWDSRNRLKSIARAGGQTTNFTYDFAGNLIVQAESGTSLNVTKYFVLDDLTNVAHQTASDGSSYSALTGRSIDSHLAIIQASGQVQYGLGDAINSTVAAVDQVGANSMQMVYEPYGQTTTTGTYPYAFTGRTRVTAELYYNRARFYSSSTGRFISEDPLHVRAGDMNLYRYGHNSPVMYRDPLGLWPNPLPPPFTVEDILKDYFGPPGDLPGPTGPFDGPDSLILIGIPEERIPPPPYLQTPDTTPLFISDPRLLHPPPIASCPQK